MLVRRHHQVLAQRRLSSRYMSQWTRSAVDFVLFVCEVWDQRTLGSQIKSRRCALLHPSRKSEDVPLKACLFNAMETHRERSFSSAFSEMFGFVTPRHDSSCISAPQRASSPKRRYWSFARSFIGAGHQHMCRSYPLSHPPRFHRRPAAWTRR